MKKIVSLFVIFILFIPSISFWACKYSGKISECDSALKGFIWRDKKYIIPWASIKSVEDFPCLQASPERRVFQIAMDENFKEIDKLLEENLWKIYKSKDFYFWKDANYNYKDWVDYIYEQKNIFLNKYYEACQKSLEESAECLENAAYSDASKRDSISIKEGKEFLQGWNWNCYRLAQLKWNVYEKIAYNWLLLNRKQVSKDQKKQYQQGQRTKYNGVLDLIMVNLSYLERVWKKWPSKTKNPL